MHAHILRRPGTSFMISARSLVAVGNTNRLHTSSLLRYSSTASTSPLDILGGGVSVGGVSAAGVSGVGQGNNQATAPLGESPILRMLMFGKPGAGKGTLSSRLLKKYDINFLSTGDLLRQHIAEETEVGKAAKEIVASGGLLPDEMMIQVIAGKLSDLQGKPWILDGFPRTLGQGKLLDEFLKQTRSPLSLVVNLDVSDEVILRRITDRWVHLPSGRVYNMSYNKPKVEGLDDLTGEPLVQRPDDNPETFSRRLDAFYKSTSPLLQYYGSASSTGTGQAQLVSLAGSTSDEIWPQLEKVVDQFGLRLRTVVPEAVVKEVEKEVVGTRKVGTEETQGALESRS